MTEYSRQKAIAWLKEELDRCRRAPDLNGCKMQPQRPVVQRCGNCRGGDAGQVADGHFGRQIGRQRGGRLHLQRPGACRQVGLQV